MYRETADIEVTPVHRAQGPKAVVLLVIVKD